MMKNFKLLCLFLVILFVSTESAPKGGRGGGRRGGGGIRFFGTGLSATEVIIIFVGISVAVLVIICICYACQSDDGNCKNCEDYEEDNISNIYENRSVTNDYDQQPMRSSQIPQGNSPQCPDSTNLAYTCTESRFTSTSNQQNQMIPSAPVQDSQNMNMIVYDDKPPSYLEATNKYDQQTLASSQILQVNSLQMPNSANSPSQKLQMAVIPVNGTYYLRPETTVLKLHEKLFSFSGDDCSIKDLSGKKWFQIEGSIMSMRGKATMKDASGYNICGYRKKLLTMHATAYITIEGPSGTMVVATVKRHSNFSLESSADIYIHNPPMRIEDVTTSGLSESIHVEGDIISKKYDFMMVNLETNPNKIAQVVRKFQAFFENDTYFVEIGPNVDAAFICICTYAIDELFSDDET